MAEMKNCRMRHIDTDGSIRCMNRSKFSALLSDAVDRIRVTPAVCVNCTVPSATGPAATVPNGRSQLPRVSSTPPPATPRKAVPARRASPGKVTLVKSAWDGAMELALTYGSPVDVETVKRIVAATSGCGCNSGKFSDSKVELWRRLAIRREGQPGRKVLLVGNSNRFPSLGVDAATFDEVVLFNDSIHKELLPLCSLWVARHSSAKCVYPGLDLDKDLPAAATVMLVDGLHRAGPVVERLTHPVIKKRARFDMTAAVDKYEIPSKWPSTGFATLCWFLTQGCHVTLTGFTWEGCSSHDWKYEFDRCAEWERLGLIAIVRKEYCQ